jgi:hypothetical protein
MTGCSGESFPEQLFYAANRKGSFVETAGLLASDLKGGFS